MILSKKNLTAIIKPYKASSQSQTLVVTLPKFFTDMLNIDLKTGLVMKVNKENKQIVIDLLDNVAEEVTEK